MISEELRKQLLALTEEEAQEVRQVLDEVSTAGRRRLIEQVRLLRSKSMGPAGKSGSEEIRDLRDNGWR